jgi:hypothetical protein
MNDAAVVAARLRDDEALLREYDRAVLAPLAPDLLYLVHSQHEAIKDSCARSRPCADPAAE